MAARLRPRHQDEIRAKIQTSQLINRLTYCALGEIELTPTQLRAIEVLLRKTLPDLQAIQIGGDAANPAAIRFTWMDGKSKTLPMPTDSMTVEM